MPIGWASGEGLSAHVTGFTADRLTTPDRARRGHPAAIAVLTYCAIGIGPGADSKGGAQIEAVADRGGIAIENGYSRQSSTDDSETSFSRSPTLSVISCSTPRFFRYQPPRRVRSTARGDMPEQDGRQITHELLIFHPIESHHPSTSAAASSASGAERKDCVGDGQRATGAGADTTLYNEGERVHRCDIRGAGIPTLRPGRDRDEIACRSVPDDLSESLQQQTATAEVLQGYQPLDLRFA